jgi:hypothetical protein
MEGPCFESARILPQRPVASRRMATLAARHENIIFDV